MVTPQTHQAGPTLPPLVEPGPELTAAQIDRYRRQITLAAIGTLGQRRLDAARVLVIGAGGLGTPALQYLAGAGVGTLGVVDDDVVDLSNLHRQVIHGTDVLGRPKVDSAAAAVERINPEVNVETHPVRLSAENVVELVRGYDLVLDGADNFLTRYLVADASEITGVPVVWGAILRHHGQVSVFWPGRGAHYRDVFPEPPAPGEAPSCAEAGVLGTLPGLIGTIMASQVIQLVTGTGEPLVGRLALWDEATSSTRTLRIERDPARRPVTRVEVPAALDPSCQVGGPTADETLDVPALRHLLTTGVTLIDVREPWETAAGTIDGALTIPLGEVLDRGADVLPGGVGGGEVVLYCQGGVRSAQALERLRPAWGGREGHLRHLDGGYAAWRAARPGTSSGPRG
ncbi:molybdopterin-synthase adenylyltransferase MoeB [Brachybacterium alimentarium]|uniref:molybdopterin-synthase adenylyltransferase MoeB n=1 Tax=Brachybacterium alimentarium TaxID=47845 RepID=UPI003FD0B564